MQTEPHAGMKSAAPQLKVKLNLKQDQDITITTLSKSGVRFSEQQTLATTTVR